MTKPKRTSVAAGLFASMAVLFLVVGGVVPAQAQGQGGGGGGGGQHQGAGGGRHIQFQVGKVTKKADKPQGGHGH